MADLPPAWLRIHEPLFYSTGEDCFDPIQIKIGRQIEKRCGIIYEWMTTQTVHLDLLESLDMDTFLMSLRRFIACCGKPFELLMDNGTNFIGGECELQEAVTSMAPQMKDQLVQQQIFFLIQSTQCPTLWWNMGEDGTVRQGCIAKVYLFYFSPLGRRTSYDRTCLFFPLSFPIYGVVGSSW